MDCERGKMPVVAEIACELHHGAAVRVAGQRDPELTRRVILEAATTEFANKGYSGASVNVIAAAANVNKRMLYHYFGKKDDLYLAVLERAYGHLRAAQMRLQLSDKGPVEAVGAFVMFTWTYFLDHPELLRLFSSESLMHARFLRRSTRVREFHRPLIVMLDDVLKRGSAAGIFRQRVDALNLYISIASLSSFFLSNREALPAIFGNDLCSEAGLKARAQHITDVIIGFLRP